MRDVLVHEATHGKVLELWHGAPRHWRKGSFLSLADVPTRFGVALTVAASWGASNSTFSVRLRSHATERTTRHLA